MASKIHIDQMGQMVEVPQPPKRIVSLVPSQTELLHYLGLGDRVVGITKFCIHPKEWRKQKTIVGGTKSYHFDRFAELKPDLILGNKEENEKGQIEELQQLYPVWMSDIENLNDALRMISEIGLITDTTIKANSLVAQISKGFNNLSPTATVKRTAYFIWRDPSMVAGTNTFIDDMLSYCNLQNVFANKGRYPNINRGDLEEADPEVILLSSEPYPFKDKHLEEFKELCPDAKIKLVDGEMFSWYGSRLLKSAGYFKGLMEDLNA